MTGATGAALDWGRIRLWLLGCGAMGGALLERWLDSGLPAAQVTVIDPEPRRLPDGFAGTRVDRLDAAGPSPDVLVLAVKPQTLPALAGVLEAHTGDALLLSMLAGVRATTLAALVPGARLVRMMPNTPARIGRGMTVLHQPRPDAPARALADGLMAAAGDRLWIEEEGRFDAVTALSGSGPAYLFRFIEALAGAGEAAGLDPATAARLAEATVTGAAALLAAEGQGPAALRQQVTSPGGTTEAGLDVLDGDGALSSLLRATVRAAAERSRALAAAAEAALEAGPA